MEGRSAPRRSLVTVQYELGTRYGRPLEADDEWVADALQEIRRTRVGDIELTLHLEDGAAVDGTLEGIDRHEPGSVALLVSGEVAGVPLSSVAGFTLHADPPLDRSDELGRS